MNDWWKKNLKKVFRNRLFSSRRGDGDVRDAESATEESSASQLKGK
jgi:hypothetical protein